MLKNKRVALIGCGRLGIPLALQLKALGAVPVGLRRDISKLPADFDGLALDVCDANSMAALQREAFDYVVITLTPSEFNEQAYYATYVQGLQHILANLNRQQLKAIVWASSTGVYQQNSDEWVDESSDTQPQRFSGQALLAAEKLLADESLATIVRFSGIYSSRRYRLLDKLKVGEISQTIEPDSFSNRIHEDDCVGVLLHLLRQHASGSALAKLYLATDSKPVRYSDLVAWLAQQSGLPLKQEGVSKLGMAGSKRCSNQRLLDSGYQFIYPSYREGLKSLLNKD